MQVEWPQIRFEDLLSEPVRNGIYKKKEFHGSGARIVNMGELFGCPRLFDTEMKRVELTEKEREKVLLENGDLLFARRSLTAEGAGKCSIVKDVPEETTFESSIIRARPDPEKADSDFLYYFFSSPHGKYLIGTILRQVAVAGITGSDLKELPIPTPSVREQKAIAHILGTLDDKIELNRRMNATLEAMAQALFKSWFVEFDPVIDNALAAGNPIPEPLQAHFEARKALGDQRKPLPEAIQNQFPNRFVFNDDLGWVPEGWEVRSVEDAIQINPKVALKKGEVAPFVDMKALPVSGYDISDVVQKEYGGGARFQQGDILFARITPCLENGKTGIVDFLDEHEVGFGSTEFIVMRGQESLRTAYIACLSRLAAFRSHCELGMVGSSGRQRVQNSSFGDYFLALPPDNQLLDEFDDFASPTFEKMSQSKNESSSLAKIRDTLLPKLLSGQLRIPEAERQAAQAT